MTDVVVLSWQSPGRGIVESVHFKFGRSVTMPRVILLTSHQERVTYCRSTGSPLSLDRCHRTSFDRRPFSQTTRAPGVVDGDPVSAQLHSSSILKVCQACHKHVTSVLQVCRAFHRPRQETLRATKIQSETARSVISRVKRSWKTYRRHKSLHQFAAFLHPVPQPVVMR